MKSNNSKYRNLLPRLMKRSSKELNMLRFRGHDSFPYLSGDTFARSCDYVITSSNILENSINVSKLEQAKSLFVESDVLRYFLQNFSKYFAGSVIIAGNSDFDFNEQLDEFGLLPPQVDLYLQNLNFIPRTPTIKMLPIGVENVKLGVNGVFYKKSKLRLQKSKLDSVLVGPFSQTHASRSLLMEEFSKSEQFKCLTDRVSTKLFQGFVSKHKYVLCPRGNGMDTHRTWEALYAGSVPIIKESIWSEHLRALGLPVVIVPDFSVSTISVHLSAFKFEYFDPATLSHLWIPVWLRRMGLRHPSEV